MMDLNGSRVIESVMINDELPNDQFIMADLVHISSIYHQLKWVKTMTNMSHYVNP